MRKGLGYYSPHETTVLFLKAATISLWICADAITALVVLTLPDSVIAQHDILLLTIIALLIVGTIFSMAFAWATGTLFARSGADGKSTALYLKRSAGGLIGFATIAVFLSFLVAVRVFWQMQQEKEMMQKMGRATPEIASKCAEVASLERKLFQSDEQFVLAQCLVQYDEQYAAMSGLGEQKKQ